MEGKTPTVMVSVDTDSDNRSVLAFSINYHWLPKLNNFTLQVESDMEIEDLRLGIIDSVVNILSDLYAIHGVRRLVMTSDSLLVYNYPPDKVELLVTPVLNVIKKHYPKAKVVNSVAH